MADKMPIAMVAFPRLSRLVLLLALLPGLLLSEGERLRVCLHALIGAGELCSEMAAAGSGCCGAVTTQGPTLQSQGACEGCCVQLAGQATERTAPAPSSGSAHATTLALPPRTEISVLASAPRPEPARRSPPATTSPPGRAPTPLRI